ncbi:MAG: hypothetical protein M0031_07750, partial [Thermaerobacter sp.]|nr:hypothetical protein [Thermaerobacter sp.]
MRLSPTFFTPAIMLQKRLICSLGLILLKQWDIFYKQPSVQTFIFGLWTINSRALLTILEAAWEAAFWAVGTICNYQALWHFPCGIAAQEERA